MILDIYKQNIKVCMIAFFIFYFMFLVFAGCCDGLKVYSILNNIISILAICLVFVAGFIYPKYFWLSTLLALLSVLIVETIFNVFSIHVNNEVQQIDPLHLIYLIFFLVITGAGVLTRMIFNLIYYLREKSYNTK
jgi:hypothetical protein